MIASFSHRFIFIKTRKTGGTSAEIVMGSWCSPSDIVTPVSGEDEVARLAFGGRPRNFGATAWDGPLFRAATLLKFPSLMDRLHRHRVGAWRFYNHMPAHAIRAALPELWEQAYRFTIERDPFEKVVSLAWFRMRHNPAPTAKAFSAQVDRILASRDYVNFPLYSIDGKIAVHEVIPYDRLREGLSAIAARFACPMPADLPLAKSRYRRDRRAAVELLNDRQRQQVMSDARIEFDLLGHPLHVRAKP